MLVYGLNNINALSGGIDKVYTMQYNRLSFEFDLKKSFKNYLKHGVSFEEAQTVWKDELAIEFYDEDHSENESRYLRMGRSLNNRTLFVVFCERNNNETIRIISARKATSSERKFYEEQL